MTMLKKANTFHVMSLPVEYIGFQNVTEEEATVDIRVAAFAKYGGPHVFADFYVSRNLMFIGGENESSIYEIQSVKINNMHPNLRVQLKRL